MKLFFKLLLLIPINIESSFFNSKAIVHPEIGANGMVVSQHYLATEAGHSILAAGGNAYDASIAVAFALAVVLPRAGNIGGGGFMVMFDGKTNETLSVDYRETAPALATKDMFLQQDGSVDRKRATQGILSIGVPGTVYGMWEVHKRFGSMAWSELLNPAIKLAKDGFVISPFMADALNKRYQKLSQYKNFHRIFYPNYPIKMDQLLTQPELAKTLETIAANGAKGFYEGEIAEKIDKHMSENGGLITKKDLRDYRPIWREVVKGSYDDYEIVTMGPPSSGGIHIIQMLNILEKHDLVSLGHNSSTYAALLTEVMKYAYADRSKYLGDPDFFDVPVETLISKAYATEINKRIKLNVITASDKILPGAAMQNESLDTTHFSVADKHGNVISNTYTLNSGYGSGIIINDTGILMNNEMDDFVSAPGVPNQFGLVGDEANKIEPFKRPLSSMTPTIAFKNNDLFFTTGSPGGAKIITAVLQSILNIVDFEMDVAEANNAKRIHHQWQPDKIQIEFDLSVDKKNWLLDAGYNIEIIEPATNLQLIMKKNKNYYGYGDFRRPDSFALGVSK